MMECELDIFFRFAYLLENKYQTYITCTHSKLEYYFKYNEVRNIFFLYVITHFYIHSRSVTYGKNISIWFKCSRNWNRIMRDGEKQRGLDGPNEGEE